MGVLFFGHLFWKDLGQTRGSRLYRLGFGGSVQIVLPKP